MPMRTWTASLSLVAVFLCARVVFCGPEGEPRPLGLFEASAERGYREININVGCPSDRVQDGQFGACLMARPEVVADCVRAMQAATEVPVTVKTRIGIDDKDSDEFLARFVDTVAAAGCEKFIVHARIAVLQGLSPKENRSIPPLNYPRVYRIKEQNPGLDVVINGGITDLADVDTALQHVDGVMIGRQAYHHPYCLAELEKHMNPGFDLPDRRAVIDRLLPYVDAQLAAGERLGRITRHLVGLYAGMPGARAWRRYLSENAYRQNAGSDVILEALDAMPVAA